MGATFGVVMQASPNTTDRACEYRRPGAPNNGLVVTSALVSSGHGGPCTTLVQGDTLASSGRLGRGQYEHVSNIGGYPGYLVDGRDGHYSWIASSSGICVVLGVGGSNYLRQINSSTAAATLYARVARLMSLAMDRAATGT